MRTSKREFFRKSFRSNAPETRLSVLKIAIGIPDLDEYLYGLVSEANEDDDLETRDLAKSVVVRVNCYRSKDVQDDSSMEN